MKSKFLFLLFLLLFSFLCHLALTIIFNVRRDTVLQANATWPLVLIARSNGKHSMVLGRKKITTHENTQFL